MFCCGPGAHSIMLGGPVTVISRSRASASAAFDAAFACAAALPFTEAATSRADSGLRGSPLRASWRGAIAARDLASSGLPLPGDFGKRLNAIAVRCGVRQANRKDHYRLIVALQQACGNRVRRCFPPRAKRFDSFGAESVV